MSDEKLHAKVDAMLRLQARLLAELQGRGAPLTRVAFAKEVGFHPRTIAAKCRAGEIKVVNGRIPRSELGKFQA